MTETTDPKRGVSLWVQVVIWVFVVALLLLVAVTLKKRQQGTVQPGDTIPDFTLPLFSGYEYQGQSEVKLSDFRGKVVVLNFWASWCKPCEQEAAELQEAWEFYESNGDVVFVGADYVDTEPEARAYLKKFGITFFNGPDMGTKISQTFRIQGVPETYFIDQEGTLYYIKIGPFISVDEIKSIIDQQLQ
ncbi:MAG: TlpA family protein disulfide reductase [Anaerolineales bacterium]|jgi:cytochrome c biogenesis protein CcmG/thiol:disulfide interchange protein DsbE|nr:TlpA family protein disulfide reductase [Anaerolineales bacterium]